MNRQESKTLAIIVGAIASVAMLTSASAQNSSIETIRIELTEVLKHCPVGSAQRQCIYEFERADTAAFDAAHPSRDLADKTFRACTTPKALELETQYFSDLQQLNENQWLQRSETLRQAAQKNWESCRPKS